MASAAGQSRNPNSAPQEVTGRFSPPWSAKRIIPASNVAARPGGQGGQFRWAAAMPVIPVALACRTEPPCRTNWYLSRHRPRAIRGRTTLVEAGAPEPLKGRDDAPSTRRRRIGSVRGSPALLERWRRQGEPSIHAACARSDLVAGKGPGQVRLSDASLWRSMPPPRAEGTVWNVFAASGAGRNSRGLSMPWHGPVQRCVRSSPGRKRCCWAHLHDANGTQCRATSWRVTSAVAKRRLGAGESPQECGPGDRHRSSYRAAWSQGRGPGPFSCSPPSPRAARAQHRSRSRDRPDRQGAGDPSAEGAAKRL